MLHPSLLEKIQAKKEDEKKMKKLSPKPIILSVAINISRKKKKKKKGTHEEEERRATREEEESGRGVDHLRFAT